MNKKAKVSNRQSKLSSGKQALLKDRLRGALAKSTNQIIPRRADLTSMPLSFAQERLWFLDQYQPGNPVNNNSLTLRFIGPLNIAALEQALRQIVNRHEVLRSSFSVEAGQPVQHIKPVHVLNLPVIDLTEFSSAKREDQARHLAFNYAQEPFDLSQAPLLRAKLLRLDQQEHVLVVVIHHIAFDAWSANIFKDELVTLYQSLKKGDVVSLPKLSIQYSDFAHWQRQQLQGKYLATQLSYWKKQLADAVPSLNLPTDFHRPATQTNRGATHRWMIPVTLLTKLKAISQQENVTLFMTLLAAFKALLHRYSGQQDIVIGSPIAGRFYPETEQLLGCFINTLALRTNLAQNPTFRTLLHQVKKVALEAYAHQELPFEKLVEELQPERDPSRNPLFQVMFNLENIPNKPLQADDLIIEAFEFDSQIAAFDLNLEIIKQEDSLLCLFEYNTDLFKPETIQQMARHYHILLESIVANPNEKIGYLPLLTETERQQLLINPNVPQVHYPKQCIHQLFEAQAERTPNKVAVVFPMSDRKTKQLTYRELNDRANQLAHYLQRLGVGPEVVVGICIERSLEMIVGILGILKAGGAYVPLDPAYPHERLAFILGDTQAPVLLTQKHLLEKSSGYKGQVVCLDSEWQTIAQESAEPPASTVTPDNLVYVIYTSGSTGSPKGVLLSHYNVVRLFEKTDSWFHFDNKDVWTLFHSYAFDFSVWELWGALIYGGRLVVVPYWVSRSGEAFYKLLAAEGVTVLNQTPSAFQQLIQADKKLGARSNLSLRLIILGGEAVKLQNLKPWFNRYGDQNPQIVNMYGITETTVHVTYRPLKADDLNQMIGSPIGIPIHDLQLYILDSNLQPVPIGVPGELYIGGAGLGRGYLNQPETTAERFIPDPFSPVSNARLYKSGDLVKFSSDGDLHYLGRLDKQIKIRGHRIEPGEIEATLSQYPKIKENVVLACRLKENPNEMQLAAYIVLKPKASLTTSELRNFLKQKLPQHLIPSTFVFLDSLPLTSHGKIDQHNLPDANLERSTLETKYVAPGTALEQVLVNIWAEILDIETVGVNDSFFELGGHSLLATQIISQVNSLFKVELPLRTLFESPTVVGLVEALDALSGNLTTLEKTAQLLLELTQLSDEEVNIMLQNQSNVK